MNIVDWIIVIFVLFFALNGLRHGFVRGAAGLVGILVAFFIAVRFMHELSHIMLRMFDLEPKIAVLLTAAIIFVLSFGGFLLLARLLKAILEMAALGWVDRVAGVLLGLLKGVLIASILALVLSLVPLGGQYRTELNRSALFYPIAQVAPIIFNWVSGILPVGHNFYTELRQSLTDPSGAMSIDAEDWLNSLRKKADEANFKPLE